MKRHIGILYFSPGSTTKKIGHAISLGFGANQPKVFDITAFQSRSEIMNFPENVTTGIDYLVVGAPVHSDKLPLQFLDVLKLIMGKGIKCCKPGVRINKVNSIVKLVMKSILKKASRERKEPLVIVR